MLLGLAPKVKNWNKFQTFAKIINWRASIIRQLRLQSIFATRSQAYKSKEVGQPNLELPLLFQMIKYDMIRKKIQKNYTLDALYYAITTILTTNLQGMPKTKICQIYPKFVPKLVRSNAQMLRYAQDMSNICQRYAQDVLKICPGDAHQNITHWITDWPSNGDPRDASASKKIYFRLLL